MRLKPRPFSGSRKVTFFIAQINKADMETLRELARDREDPPSMGNADLSEIADAFRYIEQGTLRERSSSTSLRAAGMTLGVRTHLGDRVLRSLGEPVDEIPAAPGGSHADEEQAEDAA